MTIARHLLTGLTMAGLLVTGLAAPALGKTKPSAQALRQQAQTVCVDDATRLCDDVITDENALFACLGSKQSELSPACHKVFEAVSKAKTK